MQRFLLEPYSVQNYEMVLFRTLFWAKKGSSRPNYTQMK